MLIKIVVNEQTRMVASGQQKFIVAKDFFCNKCIIHNKHIDFTSVYLFNS